MKLPAKFILLQQVFKRLIELLAIQLIQLQEEVLHFLVIKLFDASLFENCQKFHAGDCVEGKDRVLSR